MDTKITDIPSNVSEEVEIEPSANMLTALRYNNPTEHSVREFVDNALTAKATIINITIGGDIVRVRDNGISMTKDELIRALKIGALKIIPVENDHGMFGFGMKTAALSIGRVLKVKVYQGNECWMAIFDYDECIKQDRIFATFSRISPDGFGDGTEILVEDIDKKISPVADILSDMGITYDLFLAGRVEGKPLQMKVNNVSVVPADVMCYTDKFTTYQPVKGSKTDLATDDMVVIALNGCKVKVNIRRTIIIPRGVKGEKNVVKLAGVHVYRCGKRMFSDPTWLGDLIEHGSQNYLRYALFLDEEFDDVLNLVHNKSMTKDFKPGFAKHMTDTFLRIDRLRMQGIYASEHGRDEKARAAAKAQKEKGSIKAVSLSAPTNVKTIPIEVEPELITCPHCNGTGTILK